MTVIGLDVGTSGCKAGVVDDRGSPLAWARAEYPRRAPSGGRWEIDPEAILRSAKEAVARAAALAREAGAEAPRALCVSSFGETVVPLARDLSVLRDAIMYFDPRGAEESASLSEGLGPDRVYAISGAPPDPMYSIAKIMWLKRHEPELFARAAEFRLVADFVLRKLGARPHVDFSLAARTGALDVSKGEWSGEILGFAGLEAERLGECLRSGTVVGELGREAAEELGMRPGALLVAGGHDQACAALGSGVTGPRIAVDGLGTTECVTPSFPEPILNERMAEAGFACVPHVVPGLYLTYAFTLSCGSALSWYLDAFGPPRGERPGEAVEALIADALGAAEGPGTVFFLPHLAGAATPFMDGGARGAFMGLGLATTGRELLRAILEGITYEIMVNVERLESAGVRIDELRVAGGLSRSEAYLRLKADMMGRPLVCLGSPEAGVLGASILALCACGAFPDAAAAAGSLVGKGRVLEPDPGRSARYRESFETYKRMYPAARSALRAARAGL